MYRLEKKYWEVAGKKIIVVLANCYQSPCGHASPVRNTFVVKVIRSQCTLFILLPPLPNARSEAYCHAHFG